MGYYAKEIPKLEKAIEELLKKEGWQ